MPEVKWDSSKAKQAVRKAGMKAVMESAEVILMEAKDAAPKDTGTLRRSGTVTKAKTSAFISFNTPYAVAVHEGYDPRVITVSKKKVLACPTRKFKGTINPYGSGKLPQLSKDGKFVILGRRVKHPGYKGKKYLEDTFNRHKDEARRHIQNAVNKALREAGD